jgi:polysaccharide export outer membrane protein
MKSLTSKIITCVVLFGIGGYLIGTPQQSEQSINTHTVDSSLISPVVAQQTQQTDDELNQQIISDPNIQLCQGFDTCGCGVENCGGGCDSASFSSGFGYGSAAPAMAGRSVEGVGPYTQGRNGGEGRWSNHEQVPWEQFAYGEYIGPHRTPHVPEYRLRVNDSLEFVYLRTREKSLEPYRLYVGDTISISSAIDPSLTQQNLVVRSDGMVSLSLIGQVSTAGKTVENLQRELNDKYTKFVKNPAIVVQVNQGDTPLQDLVDSVDARAGQGGQARAATVSPDGTVQLPGIGSVPAIGLTLDEIGREVNARYRLRQGGIEVTPILIQRAPRFIYVVGQVGQPGRFELVGPTTVMQALALAQGDLQGGNLRQAIVFRRDQDWRLTATRLDLNGALIGRRPQPSDDIWLRDSDIVLIPKKPVQRLSEAVNLYFSNTLYGLFPGQLGSFDAGAVIQ